MQLDCKARPFVDAKGGLELHKFAFQQLTAFLDDNSLENPVPDDDREYGHEQQAYDHGQTLRSPPGWA